MDIDPDAALSALEQLEAEKQRRIQTRIDAGELRLVDDTVSVGSPESIDEAVERAKADALNKYGNNPPLHFDFLVIVTGVVRTGEEYSPDALPSSPGPSPPPERSEETEHAAPAEPVYCAPPRPRTPVEIVLDHGDDDGNPGRVAQGFYSVEDGTLVLEGTDGRTVTSQRLQEGQAALSEAKRLLRKAATPDNAEFNRPLRYPSAGYA